MAILPNIIAAVAASVEDQTYSRPSSRRPNSHRNQRADIPFTLTPSSACQTPSTTEVLLQVQQTRAVCLECPSPPVTSLPHLQWTVIALGAFSTVLLLLLYIVTRRFRDYKSNAECGISCGVSRAKPLRSPLILDAVREIAYLGEIRMPSHTRLVTRPIRMFFLGLSWVSMLRLSRMRTGMPLDSKRKVLRQWVLPTRGRNEQENLHGQPR
ncbi:hypothetical protein V8F20_008902 [Naviculisporaceae sp. PSN 640]